MVYSMKKPKRISALSYTTEALHEAQRAFNEARDRESIDRCIERLTVLEQSRSDALDLLREAEKERMY